MTGPSKGAVSTPGRKPSAEHFQGTVTVIVGREKKAYILHKDLLCFYSDYFRAAFKGYFKEAAESKIEFFDEETDLFDAYQVWLYTRELPGPSGDRENLHFLVDMWYFGDQYQTPLLQNQAIDKIFARLAKSNYFDPDMVPVIYAATMAGSPLRKAVIEIVACTIDFEKWSPSTTGWTIECLSDLVLAMNQARLSTDVTFPDLPKRDKCFFHVHGKNEHC